MDNILIAPTLDSIISRKKGLPRGHLIEWYGSDGGGKTTLAILAMASAQRMGLKVGYIDAEYSYNPEHQSFLGVDIEKLDVRFPESGEDALNNVIEMCGDGYGLVVVDSVAGLVPEAQIEAEEIEMGGQYGRIAALLAKGLPLIRNAAHRGSTCVVFINQIRAKIQTFGMGPTTDSFGGYALKHFVSARFEISRVAWIKYANEVVGYKMKMRAPKKNRFATPNRDAFIDVICDHSVDIHKLNERRKTKIELVQEVKDAIHSSKI